MRPVTLVKKRISVFKFWLAAIVLAGMSNAVAQDWQVIGDPRAVMQEGYIQVVGGSEERQSRYRALRAATVVAQRDLLEAFQGLTISGDTTVKDGMLANDRINSQVKGFLRGAVKCGEKYHPERGYAEVCMRLYIRGKGGAYDVILPLLTKEGIAEKAAPKAPDFVPSQTQGLVPKVIDRSEGKVSEPIASKPRTPASIEVAKPSELTHASDGLMLVVGGLGFKPAIVNRIITEKGDLVFGPSRVVNTVLVDRGCGGFTNSEDKAKGLLATWGSANPMQIKGKDVRRGTDVVIGADEAVAIYTHDQKTNFLSLAKVVFVIQ